MTEENEEKILLVAARATGPGVAGSEPYIGACGCLLIVSPTGMAQMAANPRIEAKCMECSGYDQATMVLTGAMGQNRAMPGQREELEKSIGKAETDRIWKLLNMKVVDPSDPS